MKFFIPALLVIAIACNRIDHASGKLARIEEDTVDRIFVKNAFNAEDISPMQLIKQLENYNVKDSAFFVFNIMHDFPQDWISAADVDSLFKKLNSKQKAACLLNPLSSFIPTNNYGEIGAYAAMMIKAYKEGKNFNFGNYACPKVDEKLNKELEEWYFIVKSTTK